MINFIHKLKTTIRKNLWKFICNLTRWIGTGGLLYLLKIAYGNTIQGYLGLGCLVLIYISMGYEQYRANNADYFRKKEEKENINADT